jgi:hypothetical protein
VYIACTDLTSVEAMYLAFGSHIGMVLPEKFQKMILNSSASHDLTPNLSSFQKLTPRTPIPSIQGTLFYFSPYLRVKRP